jgi:phosphatidylinositol kinase/protein kinase (PI-3  family)
LQEISPVWGDPRIGQRLGYLLRGASTSRKSLPNTESEELPQVFQKIEKQLPQLMALDLQYVSPELLNVRNLDLAVPGNYPFIVYINIF